MKAPLLFDIPPDRPSKHDRLSEFKKRHGIWTHRCYGMKRKNHPWCALLTDHSRRMLGIPPELHPVEIIASYASALEDQGWLVTGEGELSAIRELCRINDIPCNL